jgi:tetratricopeptide (TPR) repeat protein
MEKGLYQKAEDLCRQFLRDVQDNPVVRATLYNTYLCRRQFDAAFAEAERFSHYGATDKYLIGDVLLLKDDFAGAEKIYQQVFLKDPYSGRYLLIMLDLAQGKFDDAVRLARQNVADATWSSDIQISYWQLTAALEGKGDYEEASQAWSQYLRKTAALRQSESDAPAPYLPEQQRADLFIMGRIQAEMGSLAEAQKTADELRALGEKSVNPRDMKYYEHVQGLIELKSKNPRRAADLCARACQGLYFENIDWKYSHDYPQLFDGLARTLYESGELDKARSEFERITLLTTTRWGSGDIYARAFYMMGKIAEKQGDKVKAREYYTKFLDLWKDADSGLPEVEDARKRLAGLRG